MDPPPGYRDTSLSITPQVTECTDLRVVVTVIICRVFQLSYCRSVAVFVVVACAVASAFPFQPTTSLHDDVFRPQHDDAPIVAEHGDDAGAAAHKPGSTYHFQYAVHDPVTGDEKSQNEVGDGHGSVKGSYSLVEADGSTRIVEYTADDVHGFRAEVKRIEPSVKHLQQHGGEPSAAIADAEIPSYKFGDFAAENAAASAAAAASRPAVDYELQQSLHYNYPMQQHQPELHFTSSHRRRWSLSHKSLLLLSLHILSFDREVIK